MSSPTGSYLRKSPAWTSATQVSRTTRCIQSKFGPVQWPFLEIKPQVSFQAIVDAIVVGPEAVRTAEAEDILGLNPDSILRARARSNMHHDDNDTQTSFEFDNPYDDNKRSNKYNSRRLFMSMRDLFVTFARYGDPHASGQHITLSQSDKWMKQAGVIDNWNVTSTDTAIAFRKISR